MLGKVLHDQLPFNPPGLDRSKGTLVERCDADRLSFFSLNFNQQILNTMAKPEILNTSHNVIAKDTIVKGEIITKGDFRIDGTVEGEIKSEGRIIIGNEGKLIGTIDAVNVDIMGSVEGEVKAKDTLSLKSTGKIRGKIQTNILEIEQKAEFNGTCIMGEDLKKTAPAAPANNDKKSSK